MLILTKEEVFERISCFEKLIDIYNKKIEFFQKLLVYFEKNGKNIDCVVLNLCVQEVPGDIFTSEDQIRISKDETEVINDQENQVSFTSYPLSSVNTENLKNIPTTVSLSKHPISSETLLKNTNGNYFRPIINVSSNQIEKSPNSLVCAAPTREASKAVSIVPKLESIRTINNQTEPMDISSIPSKKNRTIQSEPSLRTPNNGRNYANVFLSESAVETGDVSSVCLSIKNVASLNVNPERVKDIKVKQFQCEICPSAFAQKGVLNRHKILRHSPVVNKPHICPNCRKAFTLKHHLKNHLKCKSGCRSNYELICFPA